MQIGELAAATGLSRDTLRFYEKRGLLTPRRGANGYRDYPPEAAQWLRYVRTAQSLGFTLAQIEADLPLLADADASAPRLREVLEKLAWKAPAAPVVSNVEARPNADATRALNLLIDQVVAPVRWIECVQMMSEAGVTRFVEVGPGKVLSGLIKRIVKGAEVFNVEDVASLQKTLAVLGA